MALAEGKESVAISLDFEGKAKGKKGCWIVLSEIREDESQEWFRTSVKAFLIDGSTVKEDTFYVLKNGELEIAD